MSSIIKFIFHCFILLFSVCRTPTERPVPSPRRKHLHRPVTNTEGLKWQPVRRKRGRPAGSDLTACGLPRRQKSRRVEKENVAHSPVYICVICNKEEVPRDLCTPEREFQWVQCDVCGIWLHLVCIPNHEELNLEEDFICHRH